MSVIINMCIIACQQFLPLNDETYAESREECGTPIGFNMKYREMNGSSRKIMDITLYGKHVGFFDPHAWKQQMHVLPPTLRLLQECKHN